MRPETTGFRCIWNDDLNIAKNKLKYASNKTNFYSSVGV